MVEHCQKRFTIRRVGLITIRHIYHGALAGNIRMKKNFDFVFILIEYLKNESAVDFSFEPFFLSSKMIVGKSKNFCMDVTVFFYICILRSAYSYVVALHGFFSDLFVVLHTGRYIML